MFVEYLVGGLTPARLRTLAARVVAVRSLLDGATFVDTFRVLHDQHGFSARSAFMISMRVHRGGGLTKGCGLSAGSGDGYSLSRQGWTPGHAVHRQDRHAARVGDRGAATPRSARTAAVSPSYLDQPDAHYRIERIRHNPRCATSPTRRRLPRRGPRQRGRLMDRRDEQRRAEHRDDVVLAGSAASEDSDDGPELSQPCTCSS